MRTAAYAGYHLGVASHDGLPHQRGGKGRSRVASQQRTVSASRFPARAASLLLVVDHLDAIARPDTSPPMAAHSFFRLAKPKNSGAGRPIARMPSSSWAP